MEERKTYGVAVSLEGEKKIVNFIKIHRVINREVDIAELEDGTILIITNRYPEDAGQEPVKKELLLTKDSFALLLTAMSAFESVSDIDSIGLAKRLSEEGRLNISAPTGSSIFDDEEEGDESEKV
jgi:hypothetical protein